VGMLAGACVVTLCSSRAYAQWHFVAYMGANHTPPADVHITQPTAPLDVTYHDVTFDAKPFKAPQYYGWRFGHTIGSSGRLGIELEFIHLKVIAETDKTYAIANFVGDQPSSSARMDNIVQRYAMSHGLNFILVNLLSRTSIGGPGGRTAIVVRGGAGPTLPHAESTVFGVEKEQYEWAGLGVHGAAGLEVRISKRIAIVGEYKLTFAKPTITTADGTGQTTALTHHVAGGVKISF
jgi:hypothetical protein